MVMKLSRAGYQQLIDEDIEWLLKQPRTLERDHIHEVLKASVNHEYGLERRDPKTCDHRGPAIAPTTLFCHYCGSQMLEKK